MFHILIDKLKNAPLAKKILIILLPGVTLLAVFIFIGFSLIVRSSNQLLYQVSGELLSYSSTDISRSMDSIQSMADFILEDNTIQKSLSSTKDSGEQTPANVYSDIQSTLNTYFQRYKSDYIDYIEIINENFSVLSSGMDSRVMPLTLQQELIQVARKGDGRLCWITDYCDTYGIFLVRSIKRIEHLRLDELGTLIINININDMLEDISSSNDSIDSVAYILCNKNQLLYMPDNLKDISTRVLDSLPSDNYAIQEINNEQYFIVPGTIPSTQWKYYSVSLYSSMYQNIRFFQKLFIIILITSLCFCILLTRLLLNPVLIHFKTLMEKISAFGNENFEIIKVPYSYKDRYDEIGCLHQQFDSMAKKIQLLIKENYEAKLLAKESQLKALEMQINPHFLYNTLQSINWRGKMLGDQQISLMTESLGKLLHITLSRKNSDSSLMQELELVKYYMNIQEIRYADQLSYSIDIPESILKAYLPKFTLQPLVENAIRYTLEEDSDCCFVKIDTCCQEGRITINVANTESFFEGNLLNKLLCGEIQPHGFGIGILNVNKRLELAFGKNYSLNFYNSDSFAVVEITIPYILERQENKK